MCRQYLISITISVYQSDMSNSTNKHKINTVFKEMYNLIVHKSICFDINISIMKWSVIIKVESQNALKFDIISK